MTQKRIGRCLIVVVLATATVVACVSTDAATLTATSEPLEEATDVAPELGIREYDAVVEQQKAERERLRAALIDWCLSTGDDLSSCQYNLREPRRWGGQWSAWADADEKGRKYLEAVAACSLLSAKDERLRCLENVPLAYP